MSKEQANHDQEHRSITEQFGSHHFGVFAR
ncbi:Uncharacterised protein [Vibrio cholerae]|nr:Uncharacterised protein [Vibrio cholerae]